MEVKLNKKQIQDNMDRAKAIADSYLKEYVKFNQGVSESYLYTLRTGVQAGALVALNELTEEINYLRHGGHL